jgi:hypothetical protein
MVLSPLNIRLLKRTIFDGSSKFSTFGRPFGPTSLRASLVQRIHPKTKKKKSIFTFSYEKHLSRREIAFLLRSGAGKKSKKMIPADEKLFCQPESLAF